MVGGRSFHFDNEIVAAHSSQEEMRTNLPKEMDFAHEARNAERAMADFANVKTSMYIPEVITAEKRVLIMEFIQGARVDDLKYLADHNIDRNKVAVELSRIFSQMVFNNGWFHAVSLILLKIKPSTNEIAFVGSSFGWVYFD